MAVRTGLYGLLILSGCLTVFAALACADDGTEQSTEPEPTSHGDGPDTYTRPVQIVPGRYISPAGYPEAREKGQQADQAEAGKPTFEGEVNGIELRRMAPENFPNYCGDSDFERFDPIDMMSFDYLLPGTAVSTPQYAAVCPDGTQAAVGEEFDGYNFLFEIYFRTGDRILLHDAPAARVSPVVINGLPGVSVIPLTVEGYGPSRIAWATQNGMLEITATDLPFEEVQKIAEGIQCEKC